MKSEHATTRQGYTNKKCSFDVARRSVLIYRISVHELTMETNSR